MRQTYVSDIIDKPGGSRYSLRVTLLVGLAMVFDGFDYMIVSFTMPEIMREMDLGFIAAGSLTSFSLLGMLIGGIVSGVLADKIGRKRVLNISVALYAIFTAPIYFVHSFDVFAVCRVLSGIGVGAVIPVGLVLVSEFAPSKHRASYAALSRVFMMFGWVLAGLIAMFVITRFNEWRWCYLFGGLPALYAILMHKFVPESVHWLLNKEYTKEAMRIVNDINSKLKHPESEYFFEEIILHKSTPKNTLREVVSKKYLRSTLGLWLIAFVTCSLSYGLTTWMPTVLESTEYLDVTSAYGLTTLMNAAGCLGVMVAGLMADKIGRLNSTYLSLAIAAVSVVVMAKLGFQIQQLLLPAIVFMGFSINYATQSDTPITIDVYPTAIRGTGQAAVSIVARFGGIITPLVIGAVLESGSSFAIVLLAFLVPLALTAIITKICIRGETKDKKLEVLGA